MHRYFSPFICTPLRVFSSFHSLPIKIIGYKCAKSQNNANCGTGREGGEVKLRLLLEMALLLINGSNRAKWHWQHSFTYTAAVADSR